MEPQKYTEEQIKAMSGEEILSIGRGRGRPRKYNYTNDAERKEIYNKIAKEKYVPRIRVRVVRSPLEKLMARKIENKKHYLLKKIREAMKVENISNNPE